MTIMPDPVKSGTVTLTKKVLSAIFFVWSTIQLVVVTKAVIANPYEHPSYQLFGLSQLVTIITMLWIGRCVNLLEFPHLDKRVARRIYPLLLFCCGATATNLENFGIAYYTMFEPSRRLVILITITTVLEGVILEVKMSTIVKFTIAEMVLGALVGEADSIHFSIVNYFVILLNFTFSASTRIYFKKILDSRELGVSGVMYYSTIIMIMPPTIIAFVFGTPQSLDLLIHWDNVQYWFHLVMTTAMATMTSCSTIMCIQYNGPLTTTIVGCLINTLITVTTYLKWVNDVDDNELKEISWRYCVGWGIIVLASLAYICVIFKPSSDSNNALVTKAGDPV